MIGAVTTANLSKLNYRSGNSANAMENSTRKMIFAGNAEESARLGGDAGAFLSRTRMGVETRNKSTLARSMQNAVSYVQTQEALLRKALGVYERMSVLASQASDPLMSDSTRADLSLEFEALRQDSIAMNKETYQGKFLFDDVAATVKESVIFGDGAFTESTETGDIEGLTVEDISDQADWFATTKGNVSIGDYASYDKRYILEKEVYFTSGIFTLKVNGGGNGERFTLLQGENVIFDTVSKWATTSNAYKNDFDGFVIEYSPGQQTTFEFVPLDTGNSQDTRYTSNLTDPSAPSYGGPDGLYNNVSQYLSNLGGLSNDGSVTGLENSNRKFSANQGQVEIGNANAETTMLTLMVERNSIFQINATYDTPTTPSNYIEVGDASTGSVTLDPVGLGLLRDYSIATANEAASVLSSLADEIEGVGKQLATIGANLSELEVATERLQNQVYLSEKGLSRVGQDALIEESTRFAKQNIKSQAATALLSQAFSISEKVLNVIL